MRNIVLNCKVPLAFLRHVLRHAWSVHVQVGEEHAIQKDLFVYIRFHSRNIYSNWWPIIKFPNIYTQFYRLQHSCGKVMFSQASVFLFMGGWVCVYPSMHWDRHLPPTATAADGMHPTGMHSCSLEVKMVEILTYLNWKWIGESQNPVLFLHRDVML